MKKILSKKTTLIILLGVVLVSFSFQSKFFEVAKQIEIYTTLFKELNVYYVDEINPAELTTKAIKNTIKDLDPYTNYYNEQEVESAKIRQEGEYGGIGASVRSTKNEIKIITVSKGFSADKAGIKAGDIIKKINKQSLGDLLEEDISGLLLGVPGSEISLEILRQGNLMNFTLKREHIEINPVPFFKMITEDTGYIVLTIFNEKASEEVKKAFLTLKEQGLKKLVLDLRGNPGGSLMESIKISNFFLPKKSVIVSTKAKVQKWSNTYTAQDNPLDLEIPIVVLINGRSASASEIVAGALQDYDRAVIMGNRSFGKGLVQRYRPLTYGTQLKVTISKYYTPSGRCIQELDYANRDSNGKVPKFSDSGINEFKTQNGRKVYDGGGVLPDVKMNGLELTKETETLLESTALFNYATSFYYKNKSIAATKEYVFSDVDYNDFLNFLKTDTTFVTEQEKSFKKAYELVADKDAKNISKEYFKIMEQLRDDKLQAISTNKEIVKTNLKELILDRYYYELGVYENKVFTDKLLKNAIALLESNNQYKQLLQPK